jgi:hypothetical protein
MAERDGLNAHATAVASGTRCFGYGNGGVHEIAGKMHIAIRKCSYVSP